MSDNTAQWFRLAMARWFTYVSTFISKAQMDCNSCTMGKRLHCTPFWLKSCYTSFPQFHFFRWILWPFHQFSMCKIEWWQLLAVLATAMNHWSWIWSCDGPNDTIQTGQRNITANYFHLFQPRKMWRLLRTAGWFWPASVSLGWCYTTCGTSFFLGILQIRYFRYSFVSLAI